jgi:carboxyl-terminal processing protease
LIRRRILLGVMFAVLFALGWWAGRGRASAGLYSSLDVFVEVLHAVQTSYVDEVESAGLFEGGMRGMLHSLDPMSEYLGAEEWGAQRTSPVGDFEGVGLFVDSHDGWPLVIAPVEGSPAWEAGIEAGDVITGVDGHSTWGLAPPQLSARMRGATGTNLTLTIVRGTGGRERDIVVRRKRVEVPAVRNVMVMPGSVGYLRLAAFNQHATKEVRAALDTLRRGGARSLVVDLRGNPGGLVDQAVGIAGSFLPTGSLVTFTEGRQPEKSKKLLVPKGATPVSWPMAVLVDGGTASAAEILAGALQDLDRALVVGTSTYGRGTVQSVFPLRSGAGAIRLTTGRYHTPSGRSIPRPGTAVEPDDDDEDEAAPGRDASDTSAVDAGSRPKYKTSRGRTIYGGGGIAPDVEARADSLPPVRSRSAARAALADDPAFQKASEALRRAKGASSVFAAAGPAKAPKPPRGTPGSR